MGTKNVIIGMLLSFFAVLSVILAIGLPWWTYKEQHRFGENWKSNNGLWEECNEITDVFGETEVTCSGIEEPEGHVELCRNVCLFGMFLIFAGILLTCIGRWIVAELRLVPLIGALAMAIAGLLIWIGVLMFSVKHVETAGNDPTDLHAGWGLGVSAAFLSFLASTFLIWDKRRESEESEEAEPVTKETTSGDFLDTNRVSPLGGDVYPLRKSSWVSSGAGSSRGGSARTVPPSGGGSDTPIQMSRLEVKPGY